MGVQSFMLRAMLKSKLKGVPDAQLDMLVNMVEKNPNFFKEIAEEVQKRVKSGKSEMDATMEVMRERQSEVQKLMQK